jgi:hypothetical protein
MNGPSETVRIHVVLPKALVAALDKFAGERGRSAFLAEITDREIKRRRLLAFLEQPGPLWDPKNHPEMRRGAAAWVRKLRRGDLKREAQRRSR